MYVLNIDETLLEALEDNSMQLQNLMGSKYVQVRTPPRRGPAHGYSTKVY